MPGVMVYDAQKSFQGYTLFSETFAFLKEAGDPERIIYLIDMEGNPVHQWRVETTLQSYCKLLPSGNLIYPTHDRSEICQGGAPGLREIDPQSKVLWHYRCRTDHDFQILANGNFLINTLTENMCPSLGNELKRHPYVIEATREKELVWEWHGEQHLAELESLLPPTDWDHVMERATGRFAFDWAHNNTVQVIPLNSTHEREVAAGAESRFAPGNFLFSYRSNDVIGVVERPSGRIVWAWGPGIIDGQHKPHMLPNGNILIFDNGTLRGYSRVIELNPLTEEIEWEYAGDPKDSFSSHYISGAQRLPNGNTLICDGANSRLFEVTWEKEIVWEFINPYRSESAWNAIYRCLRYPPACVQPLLDRIAR